MDRGRLVVIVICIVILLLTYFDRRAGGRWGVLQTVIVLAFLFFGMYAGQIVDPGNNGFSFFFGAIGMGCAFLITWLLARLIDASRERRRIRREHL
ncbi:MAG: hypothetical protein WA441_00065 [Methyloceanibacter sp.]|jgi:hypothetical protein